MLKYTISLMVSSCIALSVVHAADDNKPQSYTRPGTGFVVLAKEESDLTKKIREERKDVLAPTASIQQLDSVFNGKPCTAHGYAKEIFDLYSSKKGDMTVTEQAFKLLPENHILSVHTYQPTTTEEGKPAIVVQNAQSANGTPTNYTGVLKYQDKDEESHTQFDIHVLFDLTGNTKPKLSVVKQTMLASSEEEKSEENPKKDDFAEELSKLQNGLMHVALYAPDGSKIPDSTGGSKALRRKIQFEK